MDDEIIASREHDTDQDNQLLTFWLDNQLYGTSISHVDQIISIQPISEIPEFPHYAKGIINLRGNIIPVIDLRLRLGKTEAPHTERTCIINILVGEQQLGCIVDEVDAVVHVQGHQILPPPHISEATGASRYLTGIAKIPIENTTEEKVVLCLNLAQLLRQDEFSALTSAAEK